MAAGDSRNAVISAANLLMVAMLKLNRVLVPAFLRVLRSSRGRWVRRSSRDIASEIAAGDHTRKLCVGSCCGGPLASVHSHLGAGASMAAWSHPNADATDPLAKPGEKDEDKEKKEGKEDKEESDSEPESGKSIISDEKAPLIPKGKDKNKDGASSSAAGAAASSSLAAPSGESTKSVTFSIKPPEGAKERDSKQLAAPTDGNITKTSGKKSDSQVPGDSDVTQLHIPGFSVQTNPLKLPAEELYFRMRVMEEERHRANQMNPAVFTAVMNVYFTLFTMFLYAFIIISIVLTKFHFSTAESILFSFSLLATATISEAETLLQPQKKKKKKKKKKKAPAHGHHGHHSHHGHHGHHTHHGHHGQHGHDKDGHHVSKAHDAHPNAVTLWLYRSPEEGEGQKESEEENDKKMVPWGIISPYGPNSGVDPTKEANAHDQPPQVHHGHRHHHGHHGHHRHHSHHDDDDSDDDSDSESD